MLWNIEFYRTEGGRSPVKDFLGSLPIKHRIKVAKIIVLLREQGHTLKEPCSKYIVGTKLKELRIQAAPNIYRIFYFTYVNQKIIFLHGFTKKTEQTPRKEIETASSRMENYIRRNRNV